jgi:hypothetical protein
MNTGVSGSPGVERLYFPEREAVLERRPLAQVWADGESFALSLALSSTLWAFATVLLDGKQ